MFVDGFKEQFKKQDGMAKWIMIPVAWFEEQLRRQFAYYDWDDSACD